MSQIPGMEEYTTLSEELIDAKEELMTDPFKDKDQFDEFRNRIIGICGSDWVPKEEDLTLDYVLYSRLIESYQEYSHIKWLVYRLILRNFLERIFSKVLTRAWDKYAPNRDIRQGTR